MRANTTERRILRLLKRYKFMMYKDVKCRFSLTNIEMNRASLRLRQNHLIVSVDEGTTKCWYDKEYAESKGIEPSHIIRVKHSHTDKIEKPYIDRNKLINRCWRMA